MISDNISYHIHPPPRQGPPARGAHALFDYSIIILTVSLCEFESVVFLGFHSISWSHSNFSTFCFSGARIHWRLCDHSRWDKPGNSSPIGMFFSVSNSLSTSFNFVWKDKFWNCQFGDLGDLVPVAHQVFRHRSGEPVALPNGAAQHGSRRGAPDAKKGRRLRCVCCGTLVGAWSHVRSLNEDE